MYSKLPRFLDFDRAVISLKKSYEFFIKEYYLLFYGLIMFTSYSFGVNFLKFLY